VQTRALAKVAAVAPDTSRTLKEES